MVKKIFGEEHVKEIIVEKIKELLKPLCNDCTGPGDYYQIGIVTKLVDHFTELGQRDNAGKALSLSLNERLEVKALNDVKEHIKLDLLKHRYCYDGIGIGNFEQPLNDYERGVTNAVGIINHRIHCICD